MKVTFIYEAIEYTHVLKNNIIKIYSVPKEYSEDGLFIADYSKTMREPMPESNSLLTTLLYHAEIRNVMNQEYMNEIVNTIGEVTYAKD
jgi:hypothetical protein